MFLYLCHSKALILNTTFPSSQIFSNLLAASYKDETRPVPKPVYGILGFYHGVAAVLGLQQCVQGEYKGHIIKSIILDISCILTWQLSNVR